MVTTNLSQSRKWSFLKLCSLPCRNPLRMALWPAFGSRPVCWKPLLKGTLRCTASIETLQTWYEVKDDQCLWQIDVYLLYKMWLLYTPYLTWRCEHQMPFSFTRKHSTWLNGSGIKHHYINNASRHTDLSTTLDYIQYNSCITSQVWRHTAEQGVAASTL